MENIDKNIKKEKSNDPFDDYFENLDIDSDIRKLYELIGDDEQKDEFERNSYLNKLRNKNHKRYYDINISKLENLPYDFDDIIKDIIKLYGFIDYKNLLTQNLEDSQNSEKLLNNIYKKLNRLDRMVKNELKELSTKNDQSQSKFSIQFFKSLNIDEKSRSELLKKYNELVLYNSVITQDVYEDLARQLKRRNYIDEILKILNIEEENKLSITKKEKLYNLNKRIEEQINKYNNKINYLQDLISENSKYIIEFDDFKNFYNKIIAYDDKNYNNAKQTYEILFDDSKFNILIKEFEEKFIKEIEDQKAEEKFIYEKIGIKNIKTTINYIINYYLESIDPESKSVIEYIVQKINNNNYDLKEIEQVLSIIIKEIWQNTITDVYSFNPKEDYYFICSNNQFIDEKYETILITRKELNKVNDYLDYQIGFICGYNDNIMYITENDDIMTVSYNDMSNLKTPVQIEQEFINFKVCNRIALNGYKTKIVAVYFINDGNSDVYNKAIKLANENNLPLIELKKSQDFKD